MPDHGFSLHNRARVITSVATDHQQGSPILETGSGLCSVIQNSRVKSSWSQLVRSAQTRISCTTSRPLACCIISLVDVVVFRLFFSWLYGQVPIIFVASCFRFSQVRCFTLRLCPVGLIISMADFHVRRSLLVHLLHRHELRSRIHEYYRRRSEAV